MAKTQSTTDFRLMSARLLDAGAVALTADREALRSRHLILTVHLKESDSQLMDHISTICDRTELVDVRGEEFAYDYTFSWGPAIDTEQIPVCVSDAATTAESISLKRTPLDSGLIRIIVESIFGQAIDNKADNYPLTRQELAKAVSDDIDYYIGTEESPYADDTIEIVYGARGELAVPVPLQEAVQAVHTQTAQRITRDPTIGAEKDVYVSPAALDKKYGVSTSVTEETPEWRGGSDSVRTARMSYDDSGQPIGLAIFLSPTQLSEMGIRQDGKDAVNYCVTDGELRLTQED